MKTILKSLPFLLILFIAFGDRILPQPLSNASLTTRTSINNFLIGMFPDPDLKNPNAQTDKIMKDAEDYQKR